MRVFVIAKNGVKPLMPCSRARARMLLNKKLAFIKKRIPFTIQLIKETTDCVQPIEYKVDPGSSHTGIALILHGEKVSKLIFAAVVHHRGASVVNNLKKRSDTRGRRRSNLRYRARRFMNRRASRSTRPPPSLISRLANHKTWLVRFSKISPIVSVTLEHVKFDTQLIDNPLIYGVEYQQGPLYKQNLWQYLLVRDAHTCQLCQGVSEDKILTMEHNTPRCQGGSYSITNLCVACYSCNQDKAARNLEEYLAALETKKRPGKLHIARIRNIRSLLETKGRSKKSTRQNAIMNQLRWLLKDLYDQPGINLQLTNGAQTALNRKDGSFEKYHWLDAAVLGDDGANVQIPDVVEILHMHAYQTSSRQMVDVDKFGFPRAKPREPKVKFGETLFKTGDLVKVNYTRGKKYPHGFYIGCIRSYRRTGSFTVRINTGEMTTTWKNITKLQSANGYRYITEYNISRNT